MSRSQTMGAFVALALVAGLVIVWQVTGEEESGDSPIEILTDSVGRQTLRDELTLNGELRRDELDNQLASSTGESARSASPTETKSPPVM